MTSTTGSLALVHYDTHKFCIEWKPNDHYLIADADTPEQDDWSFVDTITKRSRTVSETIVFGSPPASATVITAHDKSPTSIERQLPVIPGRSNVLRTRIMDLKYIDVIKKGHHVRLFKGDGKVHSEYFFQNGNADGFVTRLQTTNCLQRSRQHRHMFEIVDPIEYDKEKLMKTFAELKIDDIKADKGGWISTIVRNPLEHTFDLLAKMSDVYTIGTSHGPHTTSPTTPSDHSSRLPVPMNNDEYEVLGNTSRTSQDDSSESLLPPRPTVIRGSPLTPKQWAEFRTEDGRISDAELVKDAVFRGGIEDTIRSEVWKYLLNYYEWDMTSEQIDQHRKRKSQEYYQMKLQWLSMSQEQEQNFADYRERKCQIEKDVKRTDRTLDYFAGEDNPNLGILQDVLMTYVMYNFDLGYVQGMSDLLAPILSVMDDEVSDISSPKRDFFHFSLSFFRFCLNLIAPPTNLILLPLAGRILVLCRLHGPGLPEL